MLTKNTILQTLQTNKQQLRQCGVAEIGVFGSYVKNKNTDKSDIDILVEFDKSKKSYNNFLLLHEVLETMFDKKIDLITKTSLNKYIGKHILAEVQYAAIDD